MINLRMPLVLSCGHGALANCDCWKGQIGKNYDQDGPVPEAFRQFNGRWRQTLEGYGCKLPAGRRHGPCPVCGGKDRFRFDDKDGKGTWFCSQCDPQSGGGLLLLSRYIGKSITDTAKELVGETITRTVAPARIHAATDEQIRKEKRIIAARGARLILDKALKAEHPYMTGKGLHGEWLVNGEIMMAGDGTRVEVGDSLLVPVFKGGDLVNIQSIKADGQKRPITGGDMSGVCHCIPGDGKIVAVTEGFATGVTVNRITGSKTYVAFNTANLADITAQAKLENPDKKLVIFADHDPVDQVHGWSPGIKYAEDAAAPTGAKVALPPEEGDWDDYRQRHGEEICKSAMREAVRLDGKVPPEVKEKPLSVVAEAIADKSRALAEEIKAAAQNEAPSTPFGLYLPGGEPEKITEKKSAAADILDDAENYRHAGEIPKGMDLKSCDIDNPPGLVGDIVKYIRSGAHRELTGGAYSVMALQCIAIAASGLRTYGGGKTSLITIILALSGAGKERGQSVIKDLLTEAGRKIYGDIRSDKDVIMTTMYDGGRSAYIVDEAHKFLVQPKGGSSYAANISTTLMELATTDNFKPARNHVSEVETTIRNSLSRLEKERLSIEEAMSHLNKDYDKEKITMYERMLTKKKMRIDMEESALHMMETGVPNPSLNLAGSSTPGKLSAMVSTDNIDSGLLARAIVVDCGESRARKRREMLGVDSSQVNSVERMRLIREITLIAEDADRASRSDVENEFNGGGMLEPMTVVAREKAQDMINLIDLHYDQDRYRNHDQIGSMYARISERVQMLASLMAFGNVSAGKAYIEPEYVEWSLALIIRSFDNLISNLKLNAAVDGDDIGDKVAAIQEKILRRLQSCQGEQIYLAAVKQTITKAAYYKEIRKALENTGQDAFQNAIISLQMSGKIIVDGKVIRLA